MRLRTALVGALTLGSLTFWIPGEVMAQRRGGGGGGFRGGGGGGGFRGGGMPGGGFGGGMPGGGFGGSPSFNRGPTPGMSRPMPQPSPGMRPGGGGFNPGAGRPGMGTAPGAGRPGVGVAPGAGAGRPGVGPGGVGTANRPSTLPARPGIDSVPGGGNLANRPGVSNVPGTGTAVNRPGGNDININNQRNFNNNNMVNAANRPATLPAYANRPGGWPGYGAGAGTWPGRGPYNPYHSGWVNGYWHGQNSSWNNWGAAAAGWGLGAWGMGSAAYGMGYSAYANPYVGAQPVAAVGADPGAAAPAYDYSQPIDTTAPAPEQTVTDPALQAFDDARAAFKQGNYPQAQSLTDQVLKSLPNDATVHEFRALTLFAQARYDESASVLYAVLSVGPGWDWSTLIGLYPDVDTYTQQLRALESYTTAHADAPAPRFVLAYHYLTAGHNDAAANELKEVVRLSPSDKLSAALLAQLSGPAPAGANASPPAADPNAAPPTDPNAAPTTPPAAPALPGTPPEALANIVGTWAAAPDASRTISLALTENGMFTWTYAEKGQTRNQLQGTATYGNGLLTLVQQGGGSLVGQVAIQENSHLIFRLAGGPPSDPGLDFQRATP